MSSLPFTRCLASLGLLLLLSGALSGCVFGAIYSDTRQPLVLNMRQTPRGLKMGESATRKITLPTTSLNLAASWNGRAIGDAAKRAGLQEIYYADLHTFSVLLGIWQEKTVEVYGQ